MLLRLLWSLRNLFLTLPGSKDGIFLQFLGFTLPYLQERKIENRDVVTKNISHILICHEVVKVQHHRRLLSGRSLRKGKHGVDIINLLIS